MDILIVDDEAPARSRLQRLIKELDEHQVVESLENGQQAIDFCSQTPPDIILMDIRMPGIDGIEAAHQITQLENPPSIIYCTAFSDHALQAFETHAVDYLLKPVEKQRLIEALTATTKLSRAQQKNLSASSDLKHQNTATNEPRQHICARVRGNLVLVPIEDVYYFHADQKYISVCHKNGELLIEDTLLHLEQEFSQNFLRIHRNALVCTNKISGIGKNEHANFITFKDIPKQLEVSRRHLPSVRKIIKQL